VKEERGSASAMSKYLNKANVLNAEFLVRIDYDRVADASDHGEKNIPQSTRDRSQI